MAVGEERPEHLEEHRLHHLGERGAYAHVGEPARPAGGRCRDDVRLDRWQDAAEDSAQRYSEGEQIRARVERALLEEVGLVVRGEHCERPGDRTRNVGHSVVVEVAGPVDQLAEHLHAGAVEGPQEMDELHPVDDRLPHDVAGVEGLRGPEVAARVLDAVVVEIARAPLEDGVGEGGESVLRRQRAGGQFRERVDADAVPVRVDGDGGEPELGEGPAEAEDVLDPHRIVAVAGEHGREGRDVAHRGPRLGHCEREVHGLAGGARDAVLRVDLEALVGGHAAVGVEEARRDEVAGNDVVDVLEGVEQRLQRGRVGADEQASHLIVGEQRAEAAGRRGRRGALVDGQDEVGGLRRLALGRRKDAALLQDVEARRIAGLRGDVLDPVGEAQGSQWPAAVEAVADQLQIARGRLRGERPGVRHVRQPHARRQVPEQRLQLARLRAVVDAGVRRGDGLLVEAAHPRGQHHRVHALLRERHHRPQDERVRRALVEGEQVVGLRPQRVVRQLRMEEVRRRAGHREEQVERARVRVVEEVLTRVVQGVGEVAAIEIQRGGRAGLQIDQVDAVVSGVGVVLAVVEIEDVEVLVERHRDGREGPEAIERVEQGTGVALELRGSDQRGVEAKPGRAVRIGARRQVAREGDLGQRLVEEVEGDERPAGVLRWRQAFERRTARASDEKKAQATSHREGAKERRLLRLPARRFVPHPCPESFAPLR